MQTTPPEVDLKQERLDLAILFPSLSLLFKLELVMRLLVIAYLALAGVLIPMYSVDQLTVLGGSFPGSLIGLVLVTSYLEFTISWRVSHGLISSALGHHALIPVVQAISLVP